VKPDGSVVLVGTGEPNSAIDSYYGVGILRSTDQGATWTLIPSSDGGAHPFAGLGFSKFAWNTVSAGTVVAATATTAKGFDEGDIGSSTNRGLYRSTDSGQTWTYQALADGSLPISVTDVVYNPGAGKFFASVRYHGVYSSADGTNWTRLANQPNPSALTAGACPVNPYSTSCPLYRGQLAAVPGRNEMYFWSVDLVSDTIIDEGIWRSLDGGNNWTQISDSGITNCGDPTGCGVEQAFYNLEIAAVPNPNGETDLYAGTINLYKCTLVSTASTSCLQGSWINLTHVYGCPIIANVHPDEHGLDFSVLNNGTVVMYFANDGGIYRTLDGFTKLNSGSCGAPNGRARERFGLSNVFYFPLDLSFAVTAYLQVLRPKLLVLAESEFWPNLLHQSQALGVPVAVINARVSDHRIHADRDRRHTQLERWQRRLVRHLLRRQLVDRDAVLL